MIVSIIVAMGPKREIGLENKLPWHIPEDLKNFKKLTLGHHILMGRKTHESILSSFGKPLPKRETIVVTRNPDFKAEGCQVAHNIKEAIELAKARGETELFICGGAEIYAQALAYATKLYLSFVNYEGKADAYLPQFDLTSFKQIEKNTYENWTYEVWEKK